MNWFLNLLVCNVIEREIEREQVQMKLPEASYETLYEASQKFCFEIQYTQNKTFYEASYKALND